MSKKRLLTVNLPAALSLALVGYLLFFHHTGARSLWSPNEDEYALVNREMVEEGHWVFPTVNGQPYSIKPPFFNWVGSAISVAAGGVSELTCRLPSAIAAIAGLVALYLLGARLFGVRAGFLSVGVLATSPLYIEFGRWIQINMISTALLIVTLGLFYLGYTEERWRRRAYLGMYAAIGLGTLNMGFVNVAMPGLVIFVFLLVQGDLRHVWRLEPIRGGLLYLLVAGPWYVTVSLFAEGYAHNLFIKTNLTRYVGSFAHRQPFHYYFLTTPAYFLPWTLFLPGAMLAAFSRRTHPDRRALMFTFIWLATLFLFFSISKTKRSEYMLPVFPAMALLVGYVLDRGWTHAATSRWWKRLAGIPVFLLLCLLSSVSVGLVIYCRLEARDWLPSVLPLAVLGSCGPALAFFLLLTRRYGAAFATIIVTAALGTAWGAQELVARADPETSARLFCLETNAVIGAAPTLKMARFYRPVYAYYTNRKVEYTDDVETLKEWMASPDPVHVVTKESRLAQLREESGLPLHVVVRRFVDHRYVVLLSNHPPQERLADAGGGD